MSTAAIQPGHAFRDNRSVGPLAAFGLTQARQIPLFLPHRWDDLRRAITQLDFKRGDVGQMVLVHGVLSRAPVLNTRPYPRLIGQMLDDDGRALEFTLYGTAADLETLRLTLPSGCRVHLFGKLDFAGRALRLKGAQPVSPEWVGKLRPVYSGKQGLEPDVVRRYVLNRLKAQVPDAANWLRDQLGESEINEWHMVSGLPMRVPLERVLWLAHRPRTPDEGRAAQQVLERLAAWHALRDLRATQHLGVARWHHPAPWEPQARALGFALTKDQRTAVGEIHKDLSRLRPMRRLLSGDVGTGKTAVFALAAISSVRGGGRVAILLPNERLAEQVHERIIGWWPDVAAVCVTGTTESTSDLTHAPLLVGTTALLHRETGTFDLVVVDEQHKFSREQREKLVGDGTHLLEASATCIPRSQALIRFGALTVSKLRDGPVKKTIHTRLWQASEQTKLFQQIRETCASGSQVIVVYPRKAGAKEPGTGRDRKSAEDMFHLWERHFPGQVMLSHGGLDQDENRAAMETMKSGKARILVATTLVEVGIDLPGVRRLVVMNPETLGLTQLHQLRGRVARNGGEGWFDLYLSRPMKEKTLRRLDVITRTTDGFEIAEADLRQRGHGNLAADSNRQSGDDGVFLFGRHVGFDTLEAVAAKIA
ncbi:hypothetical protein Thpro_022160 [Acidihalobacter prosperus]|uniref:ATP-dependent DNA helicase RecG n=1 Tax=Acidihalobacter prosperus TaxID=160660 RepID=A0A1A6C026_9GAMM|nr:hypothetical protein Thpro_022160 [Acidihalobacter prosperus]